MYLLNGNSCMEIGDVKGAIELFTHARAQMRYYAGPELFTISFVGFSAAILQCIGNTHGPLQISGWKFDGLDIVIRQRLCDALYAAGRTQDAGESLLAMVNTLEEAVDPNIAQWISGVFTRYLFICRSLKFLL